MNILHDASLYLLYAAFTLAVFVAIERSIFYMATGREFQVLLDALSTKGTLPSLKKGGVGATVLEAFHGYGAVGATVVLGGVRPGSDDAAEKAFILVQRKLNQKLWLLDTIVTAAPLLGLLGTILGIFSTFSVLAASGISDPQGVSAGIGTALLATAVGIGTALICLVVYNGFQARVEELGDEAKLALIALSAAH